MRKRGGIGAEDEFESVGTSPSAALAKARAARKQKVQAIQLRLCTDLLELVRRSREEKDGGGGNSNRGDGKSLGKALSKCGFNK